MAPTRVTPSLPIGPASGSMRDTLLSVSDATQILPAPSTASPVEPRGTPVTLPMKRPPLPSKWPTMLVGQNRAELTQTCSPASTARPWAQSLPRLL